MRPHTRLYVLLVCASSTMYAMERIGSLAGLARKGESMPWMSNCGCETRLRATAAAIACGSLGLPRSMMVVNWVTS